MQKEPVQRGPERLTKEEAAFQGTYTIHVGSATPDKLLLQLAKPGPPGSQRGVELYSHDEGPGRGQRWTVRPTSHGAYHIYVESPGPEMLTCNRDGSVGVEIFRVDGAVRQQWVLQPKGEGVCTISVFSPGATESPKLLSFTPTGGVRTANGESSTTTWRLVPVDQEKLAEQVVGDDIWSRLRQVLRPDGGLTRDVKQTETHVHPCRSHMKDQAERLVKTWEKKGASVVDELCELLRVPKEGDGKHGVSPRKKFLFACGAMMKQEFGSGMLKQESGRRTPFLALSLLSMRLYTQQEVDIDRFMLFADAPPFPTTREDRTPAGRDKKYRKYRDDLKEAGWVRNPMMFGTANWAFRSLSKDEKEREEEERKAVNSYIKWVCLLHASREKNLTPPITTTRGLCNLDEAVAAELLRKLPGDIIVWPALSSTTTDPSISRHYAEQEPEEGKVNILFKIEEINEGINLAAISQYPDEREFLLPLFSELEVKEVVAGGDEEVAEGKKRLPEIRCTFKGSTLTKVDPDFDRRCLADAEQAWGVVVATEVDQLRRKEKVVTRPEPVSPGKSGRRRPESAPLSRSVRMSALSNIRSSPEHTLYKMDRFPEPRAPTSPLGLMAGTSLFPPLESTTQTVRPRPAA